MFGQKNTINTTSVYSCLGDSDRYYTGVICEPPGSSGRMIKLEPERSEGFDVIIRPEPEGASHTTLKQHSYYFY